MAIRDACVVFVMIFILFLFGSCGKKVDDNKYLEIHDFSFKEGDIVFRRGGGIVSQAVLYADVEGVYSHLGIVVRDSGMMKIVHAVPGEPEFVGDVDRVKIESIEEFFKNSKALRGCVMRYEKDSIINIKASKEAMRIYKSNVLFDHDYDHTDSVKMYCTELIYYVYKCQGLDLVEQRFQEVSVPGMSGIYIFPSDIQISKHLSEIYYY